MWSLARIVDPNILTTTIAESLADPVSFRAFVDLLSGTIFLGRAAV